MSGEDVSGEPPYRPVPLQVSPTVLYWGQNRHVDSNSEADCHSQASGSIIKGAPSSSAPTTLDEWSERALAAGHAFAVQDWLRPSDRVIHSCPGELWIGKHPTQFSFRPHRPDIIRTAQKGRPPHIPLEYTEEEWEIAEADDERVTIVPRWLPAQDAAKASSTGSAGHRSHVKSVTLWTSSADKDTRSHDGSINRFPAPPADWDWDRYRVVCPGLMQFELDSSSAGANHTPILAEWSKEVEEAGFARPVDEYLKPSGKLTQTRQGSIYWNDNGDCLAIDEDPGKGSVPHWPDIRFRDTVQLIWYASPKYKLVPGATHHRMTLEPTADMHFRSSYVPWNNRITKITVHLTDAARSMWEKGDPVSEFFDPTREGLDRSLEVTSLPQYQHAASCLLEFDLTDLSHESS